MISTRMKGFCLVCLAIAVGAISGCGGSSNSAPTQGPTITATGGVNAQSGTSSTGATQSTVPQNVPITEANGTTTTATVPPGESFTAGTPVNVIPSGQPFINGMSYAAKTRAQGDVLVDGQESGVSVLPDGSLSGNLVLTQGNHTITAEGPFNIAGSGSNMLTVQTFNFGVVVLSDGNASIPSSLVMRLPANGYPTSNGNYVNVTYPTPDFAGGSGNLTLSWPGMTKSENRAIIKGVANYADLTNQPTDVVPQTGVTSVTFNYSTTP